MTVARLLRFRDCPSAPVRIDFHRLDHFTAKVVGKCWGVRPQFGAGSFLGSLGLPEHHRKLKARKIGQSH
jgi:hypothetical protein